MPVDNLIEYILYLIPGFITIQLYRFHFPVREKSDFYQISICIIFGITITSLVNFIDSKILCFFLRSNSPGFPGFIYIIILFITSILFGYILVLFRIFRLKLSVKVPKFKWIAPDPQSIWNMINQPDNDDWAVVFMDDDSIYLGWIERYSFNPNITDQEFLLSNARRVNEELKELYQVDGIGVYLNTKNVKRIEFLKGTEKN